MNINSSASMEDGLTKRILLLYNKSFVD